MYIYITFKFYKERKHKMISVDEVRAWLNNPDNHVENDPNIVNDYNNFDKFNYPENLLYDALSHPRGGECEYTDYFGKNIKKWLMNEICDELTYLIKMRYVDKKTYDVIAHEINVDPFVVEYWICAVIYAITVNLPHICLLSYVYYDPIDLPNISAPSPFNPNIIFKIKITYTKPSFVKCNHYIKNLFMDLYGDNAFYDISYYNAMLCVIGGLPGRIYRCIKRSYRDHKYTITMHEDLRQYIKLHVYLYSHIEKIRITRGIIDLNQICLNEFMQYHNVIHQLVENNIHTIGELTKLSNSQIKKLRYITRDELRIVYSLIEFFIPYTKNNKEEEDKPITFKGWGNPYTEDSTVELIASNNHRMDIESMYESNPEKFNT